MSTVSEKTKQIANGLYLCFSQKKENKDKQRFHGWFGMALNYLYSINLYYTETEKKERPNEYMNQILSTGGVEKIVRDFNYANQIFDLDFKTLYEKTLVCGKTEYSQCLEKDKSTSIPSCFNAKEHLDRMQVYLALLSSTNLYWFFKQENRTICSDQLEFFREKEGFNADNAVNIAKYVMDGIALDYETLIQWQKIDTNNNIVLPMFTASSSRYPTQESWIALYKRMEADVETFVNTCKNKEAQTTTNSQ